MIRKTSPQLLAVAATVHGRVLVSAPSGPGPHPMLVGFHGYAENAPLHLEELRRIPGSSGWLVAAVEALHPFYRSRSDEVVMSWMTRQERELAIADNLRYVNRALSLVRRAFTTADLLVYAGFSQGVAMAYRAAALGRHRARGLIVLAGDVPPELATRKTLRLPPVLIGRGSADTGYTADKLEADKRLLSSHGVEVETCGFEAGHAWTDAFRAAASRFLSRLRTQ